MGKGEEHKGGRGEQLQMQACLKKFGAKTFEEMEKWPGQEEANVIDGSL
jgi:hypothetical protein